jgi:hypothetical protein
VVLVVTRTAFLPTSPRDTRAATYLGLTGTGIPGCAYPRWKPLRELEAVLEGRVLLIQLLWLASWHLKEGFKSVEVRLRLPSTRVNGLEWVN